MSGGPDTECFDWAGLMRAGVGRLGLAPRDFWALSPAELRLMLGLEAGPLPLSRRRLEELAARFPDTLKGAEHGGSGGSGRADRGAGDQPRRSAGDGGGL
ncbi:rcc01693 family protein [Alkalilacustris brevis]|uniref:rcc01693 family protein n=1 Tax=Alkalilacustris brevis TaxID=2026338 RepID=UPI000E0CD7DB|nr:rcc01693 family protein [Alkalilacustris brevis]